MRLPTTACAFSLSVWSEVDKINNRMHLMHMNKENISIREVWMPAYGYENYYEVSNLGKIRRHINSKNASGTHPGRVLTPKRDKNGYDRISLSADGRIKSASLHKVVLASFCGPPPFDGAVSAHNNGIRHDNRLVNLRWATPADNQWDRIRHNTKVEGEMVHNAVLKERQVLEILKRISAGERNPKIAKDYGVSISTIHLIRHGRIWKHVKR